MKLHRSLLLSACLLAGIVSNTPTSYAGTDPLLTFGTPLLQTTDTPVNGTSAIQTLTFGATITSGTFKLAYQGKTTATITWTATDATLVSRIDSALEALATVGTGGVVTAAGTISSGVNGTITVTMGGNLAKLLVPAITVADNSLVGAAHTLTCAITTAGVTADGRSAAKGALIVDSGTPALWQNAGISLNPSWTLMTSVADVVPKSLFDANTVLYATADDTPLALTVAASTFVGRKATGDISAMSITEALTELGGNSAPTGTGKVVRQTTPTLVTPVLGVATGTSLATTGTITSSSPSAKIGYATGAGGAVTQGTSRTTAVTTVPNPCVSGAITTTADSMAAQTPTTFTVTDSAVAATDVVIIAKVSGDVDTFAWVNSVGSGSFTVTLFNSHASAADTTAFVFNFAVIKAVAN